MHAIERRDDIADPAVARCVQYAGTISCAAGAIPRAHRPSRIRFPRRCRRRASRGRNRRSVVSIPLTKSTNSENAQSVRAAQILMPRSHAGIDHRDADAGAVVAMLLADGHRADRRRGCSIAAARAVERDLRDVWIVRADEARCSARPRPRVDDAQLAAGNAASLRDRRTDGVE